MIHRPSLEDFLVLAQKHNLVPVYRQFQKFIPLGLVTHARPQASISLTCKRGAPTSTAIRLSRRVNAVSWRHGVVTRELWKGLWPGREAESVPIGHVTNGAHLATWMANPVMALLDQMLVSHPGASLAEPRA